MQRLRVLQIHNFYRQPGGEDAVVLHEAALLRQAGVELVTWYSESSSLEVSHSSGFKPLALALRMLWDRQGQAQLRDLVRQHAIDVIHLHNSFPLPSLSIVHAAAKLGVPLVMTVHNFRLFHPAATLAAGETLSRAVWRFVGSKVYAGSRAKTLLQILNIALHQGLNSHLKSQVLLCPSEFVAAQLRQVGVPSDKLKIKPHSVSTALPAFDAQAAEISSNRTAGTYALFVGRAEAGKGLAFLCEAWRDVDYPLQIVGPTAAEMPMFDTLAGHIRTHGFLTGAALEQAYAGASLLIVPSLYAETFGRVVIEAFAQGVPCLVSDVGALPELVAPWQRLLVFKAGDQADFLAKLQRLLDAPELLATLSEEVSQRYQQLYRPEQDTSALLALYQHCITQVAKPVTSGATDERPSPIDVLALSVHPLQLNHALLLIQQRIAKRQGGFVVLANVHLCMTAFDDAVYAAQIRQAALVLADGKPIQWAQRLLSASQAASLVGQIRGYDLVLALCQQACQQGWTLGCYGGKDAHLLQKLCDTLCQRFEGLQIVYAYAPPFRPLTIAEEQIQMQALAAAKPDILLVGLGCPKQERWMAEHQHLDAVMVGVGAVFDFLAGSQPHAPRIMQQLGLEWLFRLWHEPRRLAGRYLKQNPRFILHFGWQWIQSKIAWFR